jgi:hypothetical protein
MCGFAYLTFPSRGEASTYSCPINQADYLYIIIYTMGQQIVIHRPNLIHCYLAFKLTVCFLIVEKKNEE